MIDEAYLQKLQASNRAAAPIMHADTKAALERANYILAGNGGEMDMVMFTIAFAAKEELERSLRFWADLVDEIEAEKTAELAAEDRAA
jgi:hypothetical protein